MSRAWPRRIAALCLVATAFAAVAVPSGATLTDAQPLGANVITTTTIHPPNLLSANAHGGLACRITLTWSPPSSGATPGGYVIRRSLSNGGPYTTVGTAGAGATTFSDFLGLSLLTTYHYVVATTRGGWTSANSNQRSANTGLACL